MSAIPTVDEIPVKSRQSNPMLLKRVFLLAAVGTIYCVYVGLGLNLGLVLVGSTVKRTESARTSTAFGLASGPLSFAGITIPFTAGPESSLALLPDWKGTERINVLLLGLDQRDHERDAGVPTRTDTVIVVSIDPVQKAATMISFPRDLWVSIPGGGEDRINAVYRYGEFRRVEGGGTALLARTLDHNFGIRPTYYATIDFRGFQEIVNTLGGVLVDVPRPLRDDEYPTDTYGIERIYFNPGPQVMDGATALKYARTRHSDSDFGRMARQQQILFAVRDRALRLNMIPRLPGLVDQAARTVNTNFSPGELLSLAKLATEIESAAMGSLVIDHKLATSFQGIEGASLLLPRKDEIRRAIQRAAADPRLVREAGRIELAAVRGAASQQAASLLTAEGIQIARNSTIVGSEPDATRVIVYTPKPRSEEVVLRALGLPPKAVETSDEESAVDIRIILGRDAQLTPRTAE